MGYRQGAYALGYIDDSRDPIEVLRPMASAQAPVVQRVQKPHRPT